MPEPWRYALWLIGIGIESSAVLNEDRKAGQRGRRERDLTAFKPTDPAEALDSHHFAERFGLFLIILLGEVVVEAGQASVDGHVATAGGWAALVAAMILTAALWWLYFDAAAEVNLKVLELSGGSPTIARAIFAVGHMLPCFALLMIAAGVGLLLEEDPPAIAYWLPCLGLGIYLLGTRVFMVTTTRLGRVARVFLLVLIFQLGRFHDTLSPHEYLWLITGLAAVCAVLSNRKPDEEPLDAVLAAKRCAHAGDDAVRPRGDPRPGGPGRQCRRGLRVRVGGGSRRRGRASGRGIVLPEAQHLPQPPEPFPQQDGLAFAELRGRLSERRVERDRCSRERTGHGRDPREHRVAHAVGEREVAFRQRDQRQDDTGAGGEDLTRGPFSRDAQAPRTCSGLQRVQDHCLDLGDHATRLAGNRPTVDQPVEVRVLEPVADVEVPALADVVDRIALAAALHRRQELLEPVRDDGVLQTALTAEMVVERRRLHSGALADRTRRDLGSLSGLE